MLPVTLFVLASNAAFVNGLTTCEKVNACQYKTSDGEHSLWKLAESGAGAPRFKNIKDKHPKDPQVIGYYWNPCTPWSVTDAKSFSNECKNVAVCLKVTGQGGEILYQNLGKQTDAIFKADDSGNCILEYKQVKKDPETTFSITLLCDESEEGKLDPVSSDPHSGTPFKTALHTKYVCSSGLSTGSILVITFCCLLIIYLVAGIVFNKYKKGASGLEVIPNYSFWTDFPFLVKDGIAFTYGSMKKLCSRRNSSYEAL